MNSATLPRSSDDAFLRRALLANAIFTLFSALALILAAGPLAVVIGLASPVPLIVIGAGLIGWAALVYRFAARETLRRAEAITVIAGDALWVAASVILLAAGWPALTLAGKWIVAIAADLVGAIALAQFYGLRRMRR